MSAPFGNPIDSLTVTTGAINPQAERAVIAALIRDPDGRKILDLRITPELFAMDATREAFSAIRALILDGIQPDAATLRRAINDASLIEVETSLQEHVSAANLPVYVRLLKDSLRDRQTQAARARLVKAVAAGCTPNELRPFLDSIEQAQAGMEGKRRFLEVGELCALPPTENWLMKGYLTLDSLTVLFGDPGCGKSFLAIDIACHVATGTPWRGCPVKPGKVLYIAGEGRNGLSKRFRAWFERHGEPPRNIQICTVPIALTDPAGIAALVAEIQAMPEAPALIVVDTINRNFGPGDENATADMTKAVAGLDAIRNATGAAILAAHHSGHGDKSRGRGSSVLRASVDVEYAVEKFDQTVQVRC
ncbi:MAG: AAA family ATPase, partial [Candidatus Contendobacter sp.]